MKKPEKNNEAVEVSEENTKKPFFFPSHDRTIHAHSQSEAQRILALQLANEAGEKPVED